MEGLGDMKKGVCVKRGLPRYPPGGKEGGDEAQYTRLCVHQVGHLQASAEER